MIEIRITADSFPDILKQIVSAAAPFMVQRPPAEPNAEVPKAPLAEVEEVSPAKKPRTVRKQPDSIELKANPPPAEAGTGGEPASSTGDTPAEAKPNSAPAKALDFDKDVRPVVIEFTSWAGETNPKDPDARKKAYDALVAHFGVKKIVDIPAERYGEVLAYIVKEKGDTDV